ncbi:MAG: MarR family winged helix-turn-helix transcriptional regulator [Actinomycetota bacterium]|nr:MarR family winged helix-turn-helix transcriptional regulator [Actinomycetota bacterium]
MPLSTLLSWVLVAFTIEVDNQFEWAMPHTTAMGRRLGEPAPGPWLVSLPMWSTFMRFVPADGITVNELDHRAFGDTDLRGRNPGMVRWGYVSLSPDPADPRPKPPVRDWLVRPTQAGRYAQVIWASLPASVERRWADRYGDKVMVDLRDSLTAIVDQLDVELPDYLPTNGAHGGRVEIEARAATGKPAEPADLSALLAKTLLAFTIDFERDAPLSLVMSANPVRVLGAEPIALAALPRLTGVAKDTLKVMLGGLERSGQLVFHQDGRTKTARLTQAGQAAENNYAKRVEAIEREWRSRFGPATDELRRALEAVVGHPVLARSQLSAAIQPRRTGWRAKMATPELLPHHPVISHRGGYPDGS